MGIEDGIVWEEHGYFKLQKKLIKKFVHIIMNDLWLCDKNYKKNWNKIVKMIWLLRKIYVKNKQILFGICGLTDGS